MEILKNFKLLEESWEEFPLVKILPGEDVFVSLPVCSIPFQAKFVQPALVVKQNQIPFAVELEELKKKLEGTKRFFLVASEEGSLSEVDEKEAKIIVRLPSDTDITQLILKEGQILKQETQKE
jgi:hypothetical protein